MTALCETIEPNSLATRVAGGDAMRYRIVRLLLREAAGSAALAREHWTAGDEKAIGWRKQELLVLSLAVVFLILLIAPSRPSGMPP